MRLSLRQQLAEFIRRRQGSLTLEQLARRIGISDSTLCRLKAGRGNCSMDTLEQLCRVFHCTLADIFPDEYPQPVLQSVPVASTHHAGAVLLQNASMAGRPA